MSESRIPDGRRPPAGSSTSGGDGRPSMIDLPLQHQPSSPQSPESGPPPSGPHAPPSAPSRESQRKRRPALVGAILGLVIGLVLWWLFWPAPARIVTSETALVFETVRIGQDGGARAFILSNAGERSLRVAALEMVGDAAADFSIGAEECLSGPIPPGGECGVEITYQPLAAGDRRAVFEVLGKAGNSPFGLPVSASAVAPALGLAPESMNFGAVQVQQQRGRLQLTISNVGSASLELGRVRFEGPNADEFDRDGRCRQTTLQPGEACSFDVRFAPTAAGQRVAELLIASDDPDQPTRLPLRGEGVWEGPPLDAEPERLELGEQRVGRRSAGERVRFVNRTDGVVEIAGVVLVPEETGFVIAGDGCGSRTLISGASCDVSVTIEPATEGAMVATLEVRFTAAGTLRVPLTAQGVAPRLEVATGTLDFGRLRTGFESRAKEATLVNTGSATLSIERVRLIGRDPGEFILKEDCRGSTIQAGERCPVRVAFRPRSTGDRRAVLEITASEDLEPLEVVLNGAGTVADLAVEPSSVSWRSMQIGKAEDRRLRISNNGSARLEVRGLRVVGDAASDFAVRGIECRLDAGLAPGEGCEFSIRFAPSVEGRREAEIEIIHNGPESPFRVGLNGTGETARPLFRASRQDFGFGSVAVGSRSEIGTLTITNPGSAWLPLRGISLRGRNGSDFEIVAGTCDGVTALAPGGRCTVGVRFIPAAPGRRQGTLEVRHGAEGSPALVSLAGVGS